MFSATSPHWEGVILIWLFLSTAGTLFSVLLHKCFGVAYASPISVAIQIMGRVHSLQGEWVTSPIF